MQPLPNHFGLLLIDKVMPVMLDILNSIRQNVNPATEGVTQTLQNCAKFNTNLLSDTMSEKMKRKKHF